MADQQKGIIYSKGVKGMGMARSNTGGRSFYEKIGFQPCSLVLDGGESGETGVEDGVLTMVKAL